MAKRLGKLLTKLIPRSFEYLKLPSGITTPKACSSEYISVNPATENVRFPMPHSLDLGGQDWKEEFSETAQELWRFSQATIDSSASLVNAQGHLVWELSEDFMHSSPACHPKFELKWKNLYQKTRIKKETVFNLAHHFDENPYHWLLDGIARLSLLQHTTKPVDALYIPLRNRYQKESLMLALQSMQLDIPIINAANVSDLKVQSLYQPSFALFDTRTHLAPAQWACDYVRDVLGKPSQECMRRIYISRPDASYRRVLNEDALVDLLQKYGFERVVLSQLSFAQQRDLFAQSEAIVAPHGAGLAHLLFCAPGTKVIEIFYPQFMQACYWQISKHMQLDYTFCQGEPLDSSEAHWPFEDILVDIDKIKRVLEMKKLN